MDSLIQLLISSITTVVDSIQKPTNCLQFAYLADTNGCFKALQALVSLITTAVLLVFRHWYSQ